MIIINVTKTFKPIHTQKIPHTACPNCQKKSHLEMTFYQLHVDTGWIYRVSKKISSSVYCSACDREIPNVKWTSELENYFNTRKKQIEIEKPYKKFSKTYKAVLLFLLALFLVGAYFLTAAYLQNETKKEMIKNPKIGDTYMTFYTFRLSFVEYDRQGFTWARINRINGDTLVLQFHKNKNVTEASHIDLSKENFNGRIIKISKSALAEKEKLESFKSKEEEFFEFSENIYEYKR